MNNLNKREDIFPLFLPPIPNCPTRYGDAYEENIYLSLKTNLVNAFICFFEQSSSSFGVLE